MPASSWSAISSSQIQPHPAFHKRSELYDPCKELPWCCAGAGEGSFTAAPATSLGRASAFCTSARQAELQQLQAQQPDFPMDEKACFQAAADGNVELLQYLLSQQAPVPALRCVLRAATEGHGSALELLRVEFPHCFEPDQAMQLAAAVGDLRAVQALRTLDPPSPWDESICLTAARRGHVHVLAWIRQQTPPCPWDESVAAAAAAEAQLPVLQWLRSQPKPCPWDASVCSAAATEGHLGTLQWLRAQPEPCPWDEATCQEAAISGCLPLLQWLRNQPEPCPWDKSACCAAAAEGNLHVLQWIRDPSQHAPCPWDGAVTSLAAGRGHLHILQWIQTHGSSDLFNYRTAIAAFDGKQHHVLTWLLRERVLSAASMQPLRAIASSRRGLMLALHAHGLLDGLIWDHMVVALMLGDLQIVQLMLQQICQQNLQFPAMREVISGGSLFPTFDFPAAQVHYWQGQSPNPQHLEVAQMLLERSPCFDSSEQHRLAQLAAEQESIIPVQLAARGVQPIIRWNAVTHQLAAAHGSPALLRLVLPLFRHCTILQGSAQYVILHMDRRVQFLQHRPFRCPTLCLDRSPGLCG